MLTIMLRAPSKMLRVPRIFNGTTLSAISTSFANLFTSLPRGVVSKYDMGAFMTPKVTTKFGTAH